MVKVTQLQVYMVLCHNEDLQKHNEDLQKQTEGM